MDLRPVGARIHAKAIVWVAESGVIPIVAEGSSGTSVGYVSYVAKAVVHPERVMAVDAIVPAEP